MARSFNGSTQFGSASHALSAFNLLDNAPFTVSGWINTTQSGAPSNLMSTWNFSVASGWVFNISGTVNGAQDFYLVNAAASNLRRVRGTSTGFNDGNWHNAVCTYTGVQDTSGFLFYKDGSSDATISVNNQPVSGSLNTIFNTGIVQSSGSPAQFLSGSLADLAIWNVVLTPGEALALGMGARPNTVRPTALQFWAPLDGLQSPEPDLSGGLNNVTLTASPTLAAGPPVMQFTPRWPQFWFPPPVPPPPLGRGIAVAEW